MIFTIVTFLLVLSVLVFIHESGHYLAARHVGVRVLQFSIGFPPRMIGRIIGETEYMLSWLPLGGFVRLEGQNIDDEDPADPRNYASKSILQRFYILSAGPAMNLILALLIMPMVFMIGVENPVYRTEKASIVAVEANTPAEHAGMLPGDQIVSVGGKTAATWNDVFEALSKQAMVERQITFEIQRGERIVPIRIPSSAFEGKAPIGWKPFIPPLVGNIRPDSPALKADLREGDRILSINGDRIEQWDDISMAVQKKKEKTQTFVVQRDGKPLTIILSAEFDQERKSWLVGFYPQTKRIRHGPIDAFIKGSGRVWDIAAGTFTFLGRVLTGRGSMDTVGGPVKIGMIVGQAARSGWSNFFFLVAVISLQLGILNLLPIPALDGGHILMLGFEMVKGKPLSAKIRERTQMIGFSVLILLIIFVTYNDIVQLIS